jgi:hypothetical protein
LLRNCNRYCLQCVTSFASNWKMRLLLALVPVVHAEDRARAEIEV